MEQQKWNASERSAMENKVYENKTTQLGM